MGRKMLISPRGQKRMVALMLAAAALLLLMSPAGAETLGDFISRKLRDVKQALAPAPTRRNERPRSTGKTASHSQARVRVNGRAPEVALRGGKRAKTVPLPRPRPPALAARHAGAAPQRTAVLTDAAGRVVVDPGRLAHERDHYRAVYLKPKEIGHWDAAHVKAARKNCEIVLAALNVDAEPLEPIGGPQGCGIAAPVLVRALGAAQLKPAAKLNCRFTAALYEWVRNVVQPAARKRFGQPVVAIRQLSDYSCRRRGGVTKGPVRISEHSFGNAIDIGYFELADGSRIHLLRDWGEFSALFNKKAAFLAEVREGACKYFSTVLSPKYNKAHENHFHFDLGRGGRYRICK